MLAFFSAITQTSEHIDVIITCLAVGLSALLFIFIRRLSRGESKLNESLNSPTQNSSRERSTPSKMPIHQITTRENDDIGSRPNFGYGDVRVAKILVHPIKSCRGTSVQSARYTPEGLEDDRNWAIIDATTISIITAREVGKLVLISPEIKVDQSSPYGGVLTVNFPSDSGCESFSVPLHPSEEYLRSWTLLPEVTIWPNYEHVDGYICQSVPPTNDDSTPIELPNPSVELSKYAGRPVHLLFKGPKDRYIDPTAEFPELKATAQLQDMYPLLLLSEESMEPIEKGIRERVGTQGIQENWHSEKLVIERFRPNIALSGGGPFAEDGWEEIEIGPKGAPTITLVSKCARCLLPNVSPTTGVRDPAVPYKVIMKLRSGLDPIQKLKPCVGCNAVPSACGVVCVGDEVRVKKLFTTKF